MSELPFIDSHRTVVQAPAAEVWTALVRALPRLGGPAGPAFARVLGCANATRPPRGASGLPEAIVGFRVAKVIPGASISLRGEHRFSRYELLFTIERETDTRSILEARTSAAFPGVPGKAYRAAVIGTGSHRVVVRRMLAAFKSRAERARGSA